MTKNNLQQHDDVHFFFFKIIFPLAMTNLSYSIVDIKLMVGPLCITHLVCDGPSKDAHHKRVKKKL